MKKLFIFLAACSLGAFANAAGITHPLYMPGEGAFMSDTHFTQQGNTSAKSNKVYTIMQTVTYNFTDRFQIGGHMGYREIREIKEEGLTNPGGFAVFRFLDNLLVLDAGVGLELDLIDDTTEGGASDGAQKYYAFARGGGDIGVFSIGGEVGISHWDGRGSRFYTEDGRRSMVAGGAKAFIMYDLLDLVGIGGEAGYKVYDMNRAANHKGYTLTGRVDINPIPSMLGVMLYATLEDMNHEHHSYVLGARLRFAI